ncbi:hypothetical protein [Vibrio sp. D431a]|uniref:hypothetical protein n=1 Tax=Vibrio sp. D431a TaxID=2837388 RepID=UPI0025522807|nr:hypothetical protein [Vibrio sp. D431a]MDK9790592.1 hypothetical protein [Vibrio sp. D431a]
MNSDKAMDSIDATKEDSLCNKDIQLESEMHSQCFEERFLSSRAYLPDLIKLVGEESAHALRYSEFPQYITDAMNHALTLYCAKYEISSEEEISRLSELVEDVAFNIEINLIDNKKNQIINEIRKNSDERKE